MYIMYCNCIGKLIGYSVMISVTSYHHFKASNSNTRCSPSSSQSNKMSTANITCKQWCPNLFKHNSQILLVYYAHADEWHNETVSQQGLQYFLTQVWKKRTQVPLTCFGYHQHFHIFMGGCAHNDSNKK